MIRQLIISIVLVLTVVLAASGRDRLYIGDFNIAAGETLLVPVLLLNDTTYSGLQTDLYLPAGLSLDKEGDEFMINLTSRCDNSHTVTSNRLSSGAIRIYVSSVGAREFSENSGSIMTISITASSDFEGRAEIELKNSICAEPIGTRHVLDDEICQVNPVLPPLQGDVNGDGEVNIADISEIIDILIRNNLWDLRGDVNGDGEVNISDINLVLHIILTN
ncbi:MAG: dockerin type I repeat-containing protein [Muribaculaceae bacterium]|nr:dockerin type I repeat-containing protein [Muribaculaceae bacterium]